MGDGPEHTTYDLLEAHHEDAMAGRSPAFADPWLVGGLALGIGILVDALALHQPPGVGLTLGLWIGIAAIASVGWLMDEPRPPATRYLAALAIVLAGFIAVRSSPVLVMLDIGAAVMVIALISQLRTAGDLSAWTVARYVHHPISLTADAAAGGARFVSTDLRSSFPEPRRRRLRSVLVGAVVGVPLVGVFTSLFASADASFDAHLRRLTTSLSLDVMTLRVVGSVTVALVVVGIWRTARDQSRHTDAHEPLVRPRLDWVSSITVLSLLVILFASFVLTQVLGHNPDLVTPQDYSRNARTGFFQLLTVAFLVLGVLLTLDWLTRSTGGRRSRAFDRLAVLLILLTGAVMVSAMSRMRLYVNEFGFTELRLYTSVFMAWLGFVLGWFMWTVLRNRHASFALGALASALVVVLALNMANPDVLIVRFNWGRHVAGEEFAERYSSTLSADSIPELVRIFEAGSGEQFCFVEDRLVRERAMLAADRETHGVLGDSWSELQARRSLAGLDESLGERCGAEITEARSP